LSAGCARLTTVRIATYNVNSIVARLPRLLTWLETAKPDVMCLQELKCDEDSFPSDELADLGYAAAVNANGRWNGVAVLSKVGLTDVTRDLVGQPGYQADDALIAAPEKRAIGATCGGVRVWAVYVPNGREVGHPHYYYKLDWLAALKNTLAADLEAAPERPLVVLGDFNIAPTDIDVWDITALHGATHVTEPERAALAALTAAGLHEVLPRALKYDVAYTYWDYRQLSFPKNNGMRIDLVFGTPSFADAVSDAYVDREERKGNGSSDHAPVVVDVAL